MAVFSKIIVVGVVGAEGMQPVNRGQTGGQHTDGRTAAQNPRRTRLGHPVANPDFQPRTLHGGQGNPHQKGQAVAPQGGNQVGGHGHQDGGRGNLGQTSLRSHNDRGQQAMPPTPYSAPVSSPVHGGQGQGASPTVTFANGGWVHANVDRHPEQVGRVVSEDFMARLFDEMGRDQAAQAKAQQDQAPAQWRAQQQLEARAARQAAEQAETQAEEQHRRMWAQQQQDARAAHDMHFRPEFQHSPQRQRCLFPSQESLSEISPCSSMRQCWSPLQGKSLGEKFDEACRLQSPNCSPIRRAWEPSPRPVLRRCNSAPASPVFTMARTENGGRQFVDRNGCIQHIAKPDGNYADFLHQMAGPPPGPLHGNGWIYNDTPLRHPQQEPAPQGPRRNLGKEFLNVNPSPVNHSPVSKFAPLMKASSVPATPTSFDAQDRGQGPKPSFSITSLSPISRASGPSAERSRSAPASPLDASQVYTMANTAHGCQFVNARTGEIQCEAKPEGNYADFLARAARTGPGSAGKGGWIHHDSGLREQQPFFTSSPGAGASHSAPASPLDPSGGNGWVFDEHQGQDQQARDPRRNLGQEFRNVNPSAVNHSPFSKFEPLSLDGSLSSILQADSSQADSFARSMV